MDASDIPRKLLELMVHANTLKHLGTGEHKKRYVLSVLQRLLGEDRYFMYKPLIESAIEAFLDAAYRNRDLSLIKNSCCERLFL